MRLFSRRPAEPKLPPNLRIYAIGDIHGRLDLFEQLLLLIEADTKARAQAYTEIILLGDLIDRGPDSAGVVQRAMNPPAWAKLRALKGNHEAAMLDAMDGNRNMLTLWLRNGGVAALESWGVAKTDIEVLTSEELIAAARLAIPIDQRAWLFRCASSIHLGDYFFVHAGVRPGTKLESQSEQDSLWIRDDFLMSKRDHGAVIVHGHSVSTEIEELPNRIGIDTGAYATGRLTALCLQDSERWTLQT